MASYKARATRHDCFHKLVRCLAVFKNYPKRLKREYFLKSTMALIDRSTINDKVEDAPVRIPNVAVPNVESDSEKWLAYHKKGNRVEIYEKRDYIPASTASQNVLELHYGKEQPTESAKKDDREYVKETAIKTE